MTIELLYLIMFIIMFLIALAGYFGVVNEWIVLAGVIAGSVLVFIISPFTDLVISPLGNVLLYGYDWTILIYAIVYNVAIMFLLVVRAFYNLYLSKGRKIWG